MVSIQRNDLIRRREKAWAELESLMRVSGRPWRRLKAADALRLGRLYRGAATDLALASTYFPGDRVTLYVNGLVRRAHGIVYRPTASRGRLAAFVRSWFPNAYRRAGPYTLTAFLIFLTSAVVAAVVVIYRSSNADLLLGHDETASLRSVMAAHHLWMGANTANHSVAANFIMINNIQVAFFAFAEGMLAGLGTVYVMAQNGISVGAIATMVAQYGLSRPFWSFVFPHGVVELSVIFMAGGAGLMLGDAMLRPGLESRSRSLARASRTAAMIILGCVPLLMIAGTIEGFYSASSSPAGLKVGVGLVLGLLLYTYLLRAGRSTDGVVSGS